MNATHLADEDLAIGSAGASSHRTLIVLQANNAVHGYDPVIILDLEGLKLILRVLNGEALLVTIVEVLTDNVLLEGVDPLFLLASHLLVPPCFHLYTLYSHLYNL